MKLLAIVMSAYEGLNELFCVFNLLGLQSQRFALCLKTILPNMRKKRIKEERRKEQFKNVQWKKKKQASLEKMAGKERGWLSIGQQH